LQYKFVYIAVNFRIHDENFAIQNSCLAFVPHPNEHNNIENDVSMEINGTIVVLAEHQSTINNNMPFR